jgi:large subunit ribosomal protein L23
MLSQSNVYTFEVRLNSTKGEIAEAVRRIYKVTPTRIATARLMPKARTFAGRPGFSANGKKAYVHLKEGDKIEFI